MRIFLDTNVIVSAFAARGLCADLFELVLLEHELVIGDAVIKETRQILTRKIRLPSARCDEIVAYLHTEASLRVGGAMSADVPVDPDDALVLGEARAGAADVFVTGDAAVLAIPAIGGMKILSPRRFWDQLHSGAA